MVEEVGHCREQEEAEQQHALDGDGADQHPVGRPAESPRRSGGAAAGEGVGHLTDHDGREGGTRGGEQRRTGGEAFTRSPPRNPPGDEERGHLDSCFDGSEDAEHAAEHVAVDQVTAARRSLHRPRCGRLCAEGKGREQVGTDVEAEDLQDPERERDVPSRQGPDDERRQLGDVVGEVVGEEAADVGERRSSVPDGGDDRGEPAGLLAQSPTRVTPST